MSVSEEERSGALPVEPGERREWPSPGLRSVAQLEMLHSLAARLNRLSDIREIGEAITSELSALIDYHNCRVFRLEEDGVTLRPIAFHGELSDYHGETEDVLTTRVGAGLTGHVAETKTSYYSPNADEDPYALTIPGTPDIPESMLGVPLTFGERLIGVIVLSAHGIDSFDEEDMQVLEVLASHAAVAIENARLFQLERDAARTAAELLRLSESLTKERHIDGVLTSALGAIPAMMRSSWVQAYLKDPVTGAFRLVVGQGDGAEPDPDEGFVVPAEVAERFMLSVTDPFVLPRELVATAPKELITRDPSELLIAPLGWEPDGFAVLVIGAPEQDARFSERDLELARGIADIASLALGNASRFGELEASTERLRALDEMKNTFLEAVSHELRTPLSAVLGLALTLSRTGDQLTDEESVDLLGRLVSNATKLDDLLRDLLDVDRLSRGIMEPNLRPTDVGELIRRVIISSDWVDPERVELQLDAAVIAIDPPKVERIVENLVANAFRHTPEGSTTRVTVRAQDGGALITVDDDGIGVPDDLKAEIFEPFRQGPRIEPHTPGVGIGLSLVARFAELHGGTAWVEDRPGGGASFRVFLPGSANVAS
jgi:signal transduction histidine kinase